MAAFVLKCQVWISQCNIFMRRGKFKHNHFAIAHLWILFYVLRCLRFFKRVLINISVAFYLIARNLTKLCDPYKTLDSLGVSKKIKSNRCEFGLAADLIAGKLLDISEPWCPHLWKGDSKSIWRMHFECLSHARHCFRHQGNKKGMLLALIELITRHGY